MPAAGSATVLQSLSDDLAGAAERVAASVVAIHARRRIPSSGVAWKPGVIVTASHTLHRDEDIELTLPSGDKVPATLGGRDPATDIAILRTDATVPAVTIDAGDALRVGQLVLALGRPGSSVTAALGIVSALGGEWRTWHGGRIDRFVRLDLAIYDGFSGGPLVDGSGRVLGINTSALSRSAALTIPASTVTRVSEQLLATGHVRRGYIGVAGQPVRLPDDLVKSLKLTQELGLLVVNVEPGAPAHKAGLLLGDVMITLDGQPVGDTAELLAALSADRIGTEIKLGVIRGGRQESVRVTVGDRPHGRRQAKGER
jgi:S1-C subfamily serine protease